MEEEQVVVRCRDSWRDTGEISFDTKQEAYAFIKGIEFASSSDNVFAVLEEEYDDWCETPWKVTKKNMFGEE